MKVASAYGCQITHLGRYDSQVTYCHSLFCTGEDRGVFKALSQHSVPLIIRVENCEKPHFRILVFRQSFQPGTYEFKSGDLKLLEPVWLMKQHDSMEQLPSKEANRSSASQQIRCILWNPKAVNSFTSSRHLSPS